MQQNYVMPSERLELPTVRQGEGSLPATDIC